MWQTQELLLAIVLCWVPWSFYASLSRHLVENAVVFERFLFYFGCCLVCKQSILVITQFSFFKTKSFSIYWVLVPAFWSRSLGHFHVALLEVETICLWFETSAKICLSLDTLNSYLSLDTAAVYMLSCVCVRSVRSHTVWPCGQSDKCVASVCDHKRICISVQL